MALAPAPATAPAASPADRLSETSRRHIRGPSLLFAGRFMSLAVNFAVQVPIVRYLSKADFGAFAYALSLVAMGPSITILALDKAISRFRPIYDEQGAHDKLLGTLVLVTGTILGLGVAGVALVFGLHGVLAGSVADEQNVLAVLLILVLMSPIQAFDDPLMSGFAVFSKRRGIFVRRYVLAPGLRLTAVLLVIFSHSDVQSLAVGYVAAGAIGIGVYRAMLVGTPRKQGVLSRIQLRALRVPAPEIYCSRCHYWPSISCSW